MIYLIWDVGCDAGGHDLGTSCIWTDATITWAGFLIRQQYVQAYKLHLYPDYVPKRVCTAVHTWTHEYKQYINTRQSQVDAMVCLDAALPLSCLTSFISSPVLFYVARIRYSYGININSNNTCFCVSTAGIYE